MNISEIVERNAKNSPYRNAVISGDREITWLDFNRMINRLGNSLLKLGIKKGDRVAIYLPNSLEYLITYFAVARIGAVAVPFNILYKAAEIKYIVNNAEACVMVASQKEAQENVIGIREQLPSLKKLIIVGEKAIYDTLLFSDLLKEEKDSLEIVSCEPDDILTILYTSGTTGNPKGAMLTHNNYCQQADLNACYILHINDQDLMLTAAPYCHIFFVSTVLGPMYKGATVVVMPRFSPEMALEVISNYKVTHFAGVPTMYIYMLNHFRKNPGDYDLSSLRVVLSAGSAMPGEYIPKIEETFGVDYCEMYGATETCSNVTYERVGHNKAGSIGLPAHTWEIKIVNEEGAEVRTGEVGELLVKGPGLFKGYWKMPEATEAAFRDEWFYTGDLGYKDDEGYFFIVGRKKEMIICGGYNVYPREIEELLVTHPGILEAAVIGIHDREKGEVPKAFIVPKAGSKLCEADIISFCKENLAAYKLPRVIEFLVELPKTSTGKILKRELK